MIKNKNIEKSLKIILNKKNKKTGKMTQTLKL